MALIYRFFDIVCVTRSRTLDQLSFDLPIMKTRSPYHPRDVGRDVTGRYGTCRNALTNLGELISYKDEIILPIRRY